jgi:hypothetical protein
MWKKESGITPQAFEILFIAQKGIQELGGKNYGPPSLLLLLMRNQKNLVFPEILSSDLIC